MGDILSFIKRYVNTQSLPPLFYKLPIAIDVHLNSFFVPNFFSGLPVSPIHDWDIGPDPRSPKPLLAGATRIYRGLGVSAIRSITTHGLLWTLFDLVDNYIDNLPESSRDDDDP